MLFFLEKPQTGLGLTSRFSKDAASGNYRSGVGGGGSFKFFHHAIFWELEKIIPEKGFRRFTEYYQGFTK